MEVNWKKLPHIQSYSYQIWYLGDYHVPYSHKIFFHRTIHHHYLEWIKYLTLLLGISHIISCPLIIIVMWCVVFIGKTCTLMNIKLDIWYYDWLHIQHHPYERCILVVPLSLILSTILIYTKICLKLGGCSKPITMLHICSFQCFVNQYSLMIMKSTII